MRKEKFQKQSSPSCKKKKKNGESFWANLKLKTIILSRNVVNINNKISHGKCNSHASVYQQVVEIFDDLRKDLRKNSRKKAVPFVNKK